MNCAEIEILICDYVDGTLAAGPKAAVERHLAECPACAELARDSAAAVAFIERAAEVEPPPELVKRILFDAPVEQGQIAGRRRAAGGGAVQPVLQPRFVMGAAMTILSFSICRQLTPVRQLRPPIWSRQRYGRGLENRAYRAWDRTVKFYDNLKFVYQIQTTLREWQQQDEEQRPAPTAQDRTKPDDHKLPVRSAPERASRRRRTAARGGITLRESHELPESS